VVASASKEPLELSVPLAGADDAPLSLFPDPDVAFPPLSSGGERDAARPPHATKIASIHADTDLQQTINVDWSECVCLVTETAVPATARQRASAIVAS
jgi:hypothetical protein